MANQNAFREIFGAYWIPEGYSIPKYELRTKNLFLPQENTYINYDMNLVTNTVIFCQKIHVYSDRIVIATCAKFKAREPDHSEQKSPVLGAVTSKI